MVDLPEKKFGHFQVMPKVVGRREIAVTEDADVNLVVQQAAGTVDVDFADPSDPTENIVIETRSSKTPNGVEALIVDSQSGINEAGRAQINVQVVGKNVAEADIRIVFPRSLLKGRDELVASEVSDNSASAALDVIHGGGRFSRAQSDAVFDSLRPLPAGVRTTPRVQLAIHSNQPVSVDGHAAVKLFTRQEGGTSRLRAKGVVLTGQSLDAAGEGVLVRLWEVSTLQSGGFGGIGAHVTISDGAALVAEASPSGVSEEFRIGGDDHRLIAVKGFADWRTVGQADEAIRELPEAPPSTALGGLAGFSFHGDYVGGNVATAFHSRTL